MSVVIQETHWQEKPKEPTQHESNLLFMVQENTKFKIEKYLQEGLPENWYEQLREFGEVLCERADVMLYPTPQTIAEANRVLDGLTTALAVLAFVPGGVELFGVHYEAKRDGSSKA